ncbi:hypothetical protein [Lelliottia sp. WAP21]|jgi:hypothetical protein|uniref:hypothetical protein n=1 Tax=Lelliottia sp. WAP21 TaxID=2877426 RepID=UPI001E3FE713|nr:hypothetical protein [Lelliottia sp. WAP21]
MNIIAQYGKEIFALVVPLFTLFLNKFFKNNAKVSYGNLHEFSYLINEPLVDGNGEVVLAKQICNTKSYVFSNEGREPATMVEIIFNFPPMYINIWPSRHYEVREDADGRQVWVFDYLSPKESIRCEIMSINSNLPMLLSVRCKESIAQEITLVPQKMYPSLFIRFISFLIFLGSVSLIYFVVVSLQWLLLRTG